MSTLNDRLTDALTAEPYRHALEQRLIGSNLPGLTGDADADLMRFVFHEQEIAGYFCGQLEKDLTAERAARVAAEERAESAGYLAERAAKWVLSDANGERVTQGAFNALVSQNIQRGVERDAAIARAERAERERDAEKASHFNSLTKWAAERDTLRQQLAEAREELAWYEENARLARLIHSEGDAGRQALANDGGERARRVLPAKEATNAH